jgi:phage shock protein C
MQTLMTRPSEGRVVAGVCAGLSERFELDATLLRLIAMILLLASGLGLLLYLVAWLLTPSEAGELSEAGSLWTLVKANVLGVSRELSSVPKNLGEAWARADRDIRWPRPLSRRWMAIGLIALGLVILLASLGLFAWLSPARLLGIVLLILGASVLAYQAPHWKG